MIFRKSVLVAAMVLSWCAPACYAEPLDATVRIRNNPAEEKVINRTNLAAIKEFIIQKGLRQTYCQMYNNNPAYHTKGFSFYLNPDTGQQNANCEIGKSDFQELVLRDENAKNQYCHITFRDEFNILVSVPHPSDDLTVGKIREFASAALKEILAEMGKDVPATKP